MALGSEAHVKNQTQQTEIDTLETGLGTLSSLTTTSKASAVAGINEVHAEVTTLQSNNAVVTKDGSTGQKACAINGVTLITGGTGIADMTLAAPAANSRVVIRLATISSGSVVIKTPAGVTFDGTNNTCTMDAANDWIELAYVSATAWGIVRSNSVTMSST